MATDPALPRYAMLTCCHPPTCVRLDGVDDGTDAEAHQWLKASDVEVHLRAVEAAHQQAIEQLKAERDEARVGITLMATAKVGDRCEHHKIPLAELERLALRECPICWKACAEGLEAQLKAAEARLSALQVTQERPSRSEIWDRYEMAEFGKTGNTIEQGHATRLQAFFDWLADSAASTALLARLRALREEWAPHAVCHCSVHCDCDASGYEECIADLDAILTELQPQAQSEK